MRTVIIHGKKITPETDWRSPREGRPECELWGMTRANCWFWKSRLLDWTRWFDLHPLTQTQHFAGIPERRKDAWAWYCAQDGTRPIYLQAPEAHPPEKRELALKLFNQVPGAVRFPIREVQAAFPIDAGPYPLVTPEPNRWFVEQTGMVMAFARLEGAEQVILNGIGTMTTIEFERAHRSILYWVAFLRGQGCSVLIEGPSIFKTPTQIYAYQKFNYDELAEARADIKAMHARYDLLSQDEANRALIARGRPPKFRIPPVGDWI